MSTTYLWVLFSILIVILILGIIFLVKDKKKRGVDYYNFFILGILWIPIGIAIGNYFFALIGLVFSVVGLVNKDKWETNKKNFKDLDKNEKKLIIFIIAVVFVLAMICFVAFFFFTNDSGQIIGGDEDVHGCLVGAGYSYCPSTEKCQRMWEEYCEDYKGAFIIDSFEDCAMMGNPVMESYPRRCRFGNQTFVEEIN